MTLYSWIFSADGEDLTFLKAFFLLLMASLHVSLNQTVLCLRTENLLLRILFLAMVINFSLNSSSKISGLQQKLADVTSLVLVNNLQCLCRR